MPILTDFAEKIKGHMRPFYTLILILVIASIFFALGRLSALESKHTPIKIEYKNEQTGNLIGSVSTAAKSQVSTEVLTPSNQSGEVIGSKSGKKYYYPWCGTVKRIKPENQVHFASIEVARAAGFTPGGNCKGLK
jgi:hypothetical protein